MGSSAIKQKSVQDQPKIKISNEQPLQQDSIKQGSQQNIPAGQKKAVSVQDKHLLTNKQIQEIRDQKQIQKRMSFRNDIPTHLFELSHKKSQFRKSMNQNNQQQLFQLGVKNFPNENSHQSVNEFNQIKQRAPKKKSNTYTVRKNKKVANVVSDSSSEEKSLSSSSQNYDSSFQESKIDQDQSVNKKLSVQNVFQNRMSIDLPILKLQEQIQQSKNFIKETYNFSPLEDFENEENEDYDDKSDDSEMEQDNIKSRHNLEMKINLEDINTENSFDINIETFNYLYLDKFTPLNLNKKQQSQINSNNNEQEIRSPLKTSNMGAYDSNNSYQSNGDNSAYVQQQSSSKSNEQRKTYIRSINSHILQNKNEEKQFIIEEIIQTDLDQEKQKIRLQNKDRLHELGISVHSRKGSIDLNSQNLTSYFVYVENNYKVFCVSNGHGAYGAEIANLTNQLIFKHFFKEKSLINDPEQAFANILEKVDKLVSQYIIHNSDLIDYNCIMSGCSVCIVLIQEQNKLIVAQLGNNLSILYKQPNIHKNNQKNYFIQLCELHEAGHAEERLRIHKSAGEIRKQKNDFVEKVFVRGRTYPAIEVTRCIGNEVAKKIGVICQPEVFMYEIAKQSDLFMILATRNFYDIIEQEELYSILNSFSQKTIVQATNTLLNRIKNIYKQDEQVIEDFSFILYYFC